MKLWQKISIITISVMLLVMSVTIYFIVEIQADSLRSSEEEQMKKAISVCTSNVASSVEFQGAAYQDITLRSLVQYYFSTYASILQDGETFYSLTADGEYLFNLSPDNPAAVLENELVADEIGLGPMAIRRQSGQGNPILICCQEFTVAGQEFQAFISRDVSGTENHIIQLRIMGFGMLGVACIISAILLVILLNKTLRPISELKETAISISKGNYQLRIPVASKDEVGELSVAFNHMAESIEEKISSLDAELERKQLLIGALSHEIKTPMTAVVGYAETLLRMPLDKEQQMICISKILEAGRRAEDLSQKMMDMIGLSEQSAAAKQLFPSEELVSQLKEVYPAQVLFENCTEFIYGDITLLHSLVGNLIQNAIRASTENDTIKVNIFEEDTHSIIIVEDHGCGIAAEHIPLLTEPFYRVDKARSRKYGGAGLGLAICKQIAEWHGGNLVIDSTVGMGTTVKVLIAMHTT